MMKALFLKHLTAKSLLIVAMHASVSFDAWTTVRFQNAAFPPGIHAVEDDPLMRPFARGPGLYPAINALPLPIDLMLLKARSRKSKRLAYALAIGVIALETFTARRNMARYDQIESAYRQQFVCSGCKISPQP